MNEDFTFENDEFALNPYTFEPTFEFPTWDLNDWINITPPNEPMEHDSITDANNITQPKDNTNRPISYQEYSITQDTGSSRSTGRINR